MASQFSKDGKYFAALSVDGKLKIWNTFANKLEQEYIPNCHLSCPCTCLQFVETHTTQKKDVSPTKKKRRSSLASCSQYVILGTNTGLLLGYSLSTSSITFTINSKTNKAISCLSWDLNTKIYAGIEQSVYVFDIQDLSIVDKWKCETNISAIKLIPDEKLLTASKRIKLWDIKSKEVLKTYTGHSSDVFVMEYIKPKENSIDYFITGSKGDRLLSCWSLNQQNSDQNAISTFLMDDVVDNVAVFQSGNGTTYFAAVTRGGSIYFYQHILNGRCKAPLKPQTVIQIASNSNVQKEQKAQVIPVPILGVTFQEDFVITICYGSHTHLTFETVTITHKEKVQCLVRNETTTSSKINKSDQNNTNIQRPIVGNDVHYITPHATPSSIALKRKSGGSGTSEVPMEKRLENLMLTKSDEKVPKVTNLSQLLIQGIHSRDKNILQTVLNKQDEKIIRNTIQRLPISAIVSLLHELNGFVKGKTFSCSVASIWIKHILEIHSGVLLSNPKLSELLEPMSKCIEKRLTLQTPLNKLQGRLSLLMTQVNKDDSNDQSDDADGDGAEIINYIDKSSDSDSDIENMDTSLQQSENEWSEEDENVEENGNSLSDDDNEVIMLSDDNDST